MVRHFCSGESVAGVRGSGGVRWATVGGRGLAWAIGVLEIVGGRVGPLTPHLTSPLEGEEGLNWGGRALGEEG